MSAVSKLVGEKVISYTPDKKKISEIETSLFAGSGKVLGLYFSAHWCPPCRAFTPQLAQWYNKVKKSSNGENFDIVFLSSDRDEAQFNEYLQLMPWYAVPYEDRELKSKVSKIFKVTGIPTLVFVNAKNGALITTDGRSVVMDDPDGKEFPWTPKPVFELLSGVLKISEKEVTTWDDVRKDNEYIGIYFSAHWCGPCRTFTPQLVETYKKVKGAGEKFEIIFCSSDREEDAYKEYFATMPWLALPFGDSRKKSLSRVFDVTGIPTLIVLDKEGEVVNSSGRAAVSKDPEGKDYPWKPKPVNLLTGLNAGVINENAAVVWFTDGLIENVAKAKESLEGVALECNAKSDADSRILFFYTNPNEEEEIIKSLCSFAKLPAKPPLLALLDVPREMKYVSDADVIDKGVVQEMVKGFREQSLEGQPVN